MDRVIIDKYLKVLSAGLIIFSTLELISLIIISFTPIIFLSKQYFVLSFMFSEQFNLAGLLSWVFLIVLSCCFVLIGSLYYQLVSKRKFNIEYLSKYCIIYGLSILIGAFIQMEYLYLLQNQIVSLGSENVTFESILLDPSSTPSFVVVLWNVIMYTFCGFTILGIVIAAGGLNKSLKIERAQEMEQNIEKSK